MAIPGPSRPALLALRLALLATCLPAFAAGEPAAFTGRVSALPARVSAGMEPSSWREGCPVPRARLAYLELSHWGYDGAVHTGELVVDAALAEEVVAIFRDLFAARFPVERMRLVDAYGGDDAASMVDDNSSGFNCRRSTGKPGAFSAHARGRAIDLNPVANPQVTRAGVRPAAGAANRDRTRRAQGMIVAGDAVTQAFARRGWAWGGGWKRSKDYQHFEKRGR